MMSEDFAKINATLEALMPLIDGHAEAYKTMEECCKIYDDYVEDHMVCKAATQMYDRLKELLKEDQK